MTGSLALAGNHGGVYGPACRGGRSTDDRAGCRHRLRLASGGAWCGHRLVVLALSVVALGALFLDWVPLHLLQLVIGMLLLLFACAGCERQFCARQA